MVNLTTRMVNVKIVWRLYGDSVESDTFYRDFIIPKYYGDNIFSSIEPVRENWALSTYVHTWCTRQTDHKNFLKGPQKCYPESEPLSSRERISQPSAIRSSVCLTSDSEYRIAFTRLKTVYGVELHRSFQDTDFYRNKKASCERNNRVEME